MKPQAMVVNRNCVLRTTFGSIAFEENVERLVPPHMVRAALAIGVLPVNRDAPLFNTPTEEDLIAAKAVDVGSRHEAIINAIEEIFAENDPNEFTTGASPKIKAVAKRAHLNKVSAPEIAEYLRERNERLEAMSVATKKAVKTAKTKPVNTVEDPPDNDER